MKGGTMRIAILVVAVAASAALGAAAQIYKWTDKDGKVHYGEKPPEDAKTAREVDTKAAGRSTAAPETSQTWKQKEVDFQKRKIESDKAGGHDQDMARYNANKKRLCENARQELDILNGGTPIYSTNSKGERVYMEDSQRATRVQEVKRKIADNC
jgi:hypothetical protein